MRKIAITALALAGVAAAPAFANPPAQIGYGQVYGTIAPGPCPQTVTFAFLAASQPPNPDTVTYRFLRSDGAMSATYTTTLGPSPSSDPSGHAQFLRPWQNTIGYQWKLGGPGLPGYSGWVEVELLTPQHLVSAPVNFTVTCLPS